MTNPLDLSVPCPPKTLIAVDAEVLRKLAQYLSHCSESACEEPEDPSHTLLKEVEHALQHCMTITLTREPYTEAPHE